MPKFSANLGFLWRDLPISEAIQAAQNAGFHAVEMHSFTDHNAETIKSSLDAARLPMLSVNTSTGDTARGEFGLAALPGRYSEACADIEQAIAFCQTIGTRKLHVLAGRSLGEDAHNAFCKTLRFAAKQARARDMEILIEPLNATDVSGYFLNTLKQAKEIIDALALDNVKILFDFYHAMMTEGDAWEEFPKYRQYIGHIQFAIAPGRRSPDHDHNFFARLCTTVDELGWTIPLGAEYRPEGKPEESLSWLGDVPS